MSESTHYIETVQITVARVAMFVPGFLLVWLSANSSDDLSPSAVITPLVCVLLSVIADGAVAWLGGARRGRLGRAVGGSVILWIAIIAGAVLLSQAEQELTSAAALAQPLLFFGALTLAVSLLPRPQAIIAWMLGSAAAGVRFTNTLFLLPMTQAGTILAALVGGLLAALSIGVLAVYVRRVLAQRRGLMSLIQRLGLVGAAAVLSVAVSIAATVFVSHSTVSTQSFERLQRDRELLEGVSRELSAGFTEADLLAPATPLPDELARYSALQNAGLTVYDIQESRVVLAIRRAPDGPGESGPPRLRSVQLSAAEAAEIRRAVSGGYTEVASLDAIGARQPSWVPLGYADGAAHPDPAIAIGASSPPPPRGERLALVLTDADANWMRFPSVSVNEISTGYANLVAPWLFLAFMLPCTLGLLALERRDAARARVGALEERARLNRDAHDRVYNRLTALANNLEARQPDDTPTPTPADEIRAAVHDLQAILGDGVAARRLLAGDAAAGLLSDVCDEQSRSLSMEVALVGAEALQGMDPKLGWAVHCIVSEALANAGKHGNATKATVMVCIEDKTLRLTVSDDGSGIVGPIDDENAFSAGSGLKGMRDRVEALGGRLSIESGVGGTTVIADIPLNRR